MKSLIKILIASIIGTITYFIIGWLVFELLLGKYMEANTFSLPGFRKNEEESSFPMLIISCYAYALLISIIFGYWVNITNVKKGFAGGAVIGILIAVMADSYWYSTSHFYNNIYPLLADVAAAGFTVGVMGGIIAFSLKITEKSNAKS